MSYHDLLKMYGSEQETAEQRIYIYVQQPHTLKTPHDVAWRDGQAAAKRERIAAAEASGITEPVKPDCYPAGRWNGKVYGTAAYGYRIYVDNAEVQISNDDADALKRYAKALAAWREATAAKETSP